MSRRPLGLGEHGEIEATPQIKDAAGRWKRAPKPRSAQRWRARCYFRGYDGVIGEVSRVGRTRRIAVEGVEAALAERDRGNADMTASMKLIAAGGFGWRRSSERTRG
jgi:hypothetical protein